MYVAAIYRSAVGRPLDLPLHLIVRRPDGQVFLDTIPKGSDDDAIAVAVKLPLATQAGNWSVRLATGSTSYPQWQHYYFGLHGEVFTAPVQEPTLPETDATGLTQVPIDLKKIPDSTRFLEANVAVSINESSGAR